MNGLISGFWPLADAWGECIWRASWQGAIALAAAWAIGAWCRFLSPRVVCWVWRLACLKLLVGLVAIQPVELPLLPAAAPEEAPPLTITYNVTSDWAETSPAAQPEAAQAAEPVPVSSIAVGLLLSVWLIGFFYCLSRTVRQRKSIQRLLASSEVCPAERLARILAEEAGRLGVRRLPALRTSRQIESPLLLGIWRPTIILPSGVEEKFDGSELRLMIVHELAHLRRHDLAWNWLPTVAGWLFFFHPLVWLMTRRWSEAQEAACDELVIQRRAAEPADYGRLLVKLARLAPAETNLAPTAAGVLGAYRNLERRILAMARVKPFSPRRLAVAAGVTLLAAVFAMVPWRLVAQEAQADAAEADAIALDESSFMYIRNRPKVPKAGLDPAANQALKRLTQLGAFVDERETGLTISMQFGWKGTDADLDLLAELKEINQLDLDLNFVSPAAVGKLKLPRPVERLVLSGLTDDRLAELAHLPACRELWLGQPNLSAEASRQLAKMAEGIEDFLPSISGGLDDESLAAIAQISSLKKLQLQNTNTTAAGLASLAALDHLQELWLTGCQGIGGAGYARLAPIKSLRTLKVMNVPLDREAYRALATLTQLVELDLWPDGFPSAGLKPADVEVLKSLTKLQALRFDVNSSDQKRAAWGDAILKTAAQLPALRSLRMINLDVDAAGLAALVRTGQIEELSLGPIPLGDDTLSRLGELKRLKKLWLISQGALAPSGWEKLGQLKPLVNLWISDSGVDDAGLQQLANLAGLETLNLSGSRITGTGLKSLVKLQQLKSLNLSQSPLTDEGAEMLRSFPALEFLDLSGTKISDRALDAIAALANLRQLTLNHTQITADGLLQLKELQTLSLISAAGLTQSAGDMARLNAEMPEVRIHAPVPPPGPNSPQGMAAKAVSLANRGKLDQAFELLGKAVAKEPSPEVCRAALQVLRESYGEASDAQKKMVDGWLTGATQKGSDNLELQLVLVDLRDIQGRLDDSIQLYRQLLARKDVEPQRRAIMQNNLAYNLLSRGKKEDLPEAEALVDEAVARLGPLGQLLDTRAMIHVTKREFAAAVADYQALVAQIPTGMNYFHLALAQDKAGNAEAAVEALAKAEKLQLDPKSLSDEGERRGYRHLKEAAAKRGNR